MVKYLKLMIYLKKNVLPEVIVMILNFPILIKCLFNT